MIINGDCISEMDNLIRQNVKVDLIITDPPYLMEYKTNHRKNNQHKFTKTIKNDNNPALIKKAIQ